LKIYCMGLGLSSEQVQTSEGQIGLFFTSRFTSVMLRLKCCEVWTRTVPELLLAALHLKICGNIIMSMDPTPLCPIDLIGAILLFQRRFPFLDATGASASFPSHNAKSAHHQLCVTAANAGFCLSLGKRKAVAPPFLQLGVELHVWNHGNLRQKVKWGEGFQLARGALGDQSAVAVPETLVRSPSQRHRQDKPA